MALDADDLRLAADRARDAAAAAHDELNAADGRLGDGDTGVMLKRLFAAIAEAAPADERDVSKLFQAFAKACAASTGSSLGTLVTVAMMTLAKATRGRETVPVAELAGLLAAVRDQMMARGGAQLGDKSVVDALDAVARSLDGVTDGAAARAAARAAAIAALDEFRGRENRLGRARMFGARTKGLDDPGMLAFARLLDAVIV
ncbi:MAG: dihydroxyacetone kinase subunit L [Methylobacteriaceae bacterium]|nr:dihydroxyacetone kinase subunit L [Methylobacteriaceae bacterium]